MDEGMKGQMEWKLCALRPKIPEELPLLLLLLYCACYLYQNIVGGAQTSDSASKLLCATHETVADLSLYLCLSWTRFLHLYMGNLLGP